MAPIITLTTDFGTADAYVASMKGVILSLNPKAVIVDVSHNIEPQNVLQAAFVLSTAYPYFPEGTIHVAVVDPGVGSLRKAIILKTPTALFVAPDNGILSYVIDEHGKRHGKPARQIPSTAKPHKLPAGLEAVAITSSEYWHHPVRSTFHGRDIFAPVAAHLSLGVPMKKFGGAIDQVHIFDIPRPYKNARGDLVGRVLHVDNFGNLITNIKSSDLPAGKLTVAVGRHRISGISGFYAHGRELAVIVGSSGYLEVSLKNSSAGAFLGAKVGHEVTIVSS
jgi:S-adenosyl-L-methionine hydrolase (adenosine-forming)